MRVGIFSDVHGNAHALEAVLEDITKQGGFDQLIFAGDLVYGGAFPAKCVDLMKQAQPICVHGNTDEFLWKDPEPDEDTTPEELQAFLDELAWIKNDLGEDRLSYITGMPFQHIVSPTTNPNDDLLVVHANPQDLYRVLFPPEDVQASRMGQIRQPDSEVPTLLEGVTAKTVAFGHLHFPNVRKIGDYTLVNISSVSFPGDKDWRAKYAILTFDDGAWQIEHHCVEYDAHTAKQALQDSTFPPKERFVKGILLPE